MKWKVVVKPYGGEKEEIIINSVSFSWAYELFRMMREHWGKEVISLSKIEED